MRDKILVVCRTPEERDKISKCIWDSGTRSDIIVTTYYTPRNPCPRYNKIVFLHPLPEGPRDSLRAQEQERIKSLVEGGIVDTIVVNGNTLQQLVAKIME